MADSESAWIRPLAQFESLLEMMHQHGVMITCYSLTLNSKEPLREYHIKRSLLHLLRKIPSLRVCIRPKSEKELWFHSMENENIDFKVIENADYEKEFEAMTVHHYNTFDGPLWCSRLLPSTSDAPCAMPEIKEKFIHQYQFLFGFHHSITDGTSSIRICDFFIDILNDVIDGKPIDDLTQLAEHATDEQTIAVMEKVGQEIMVNPTELAKYKKLVSGKLEDVLFLKAYPAPKNIKHKTKNIRHSLTKEETTSFLKRCKKEGVTIHSGFCSIVNAAIVEMLVTAGIKEKTFHIRNYHTVNNRRYWEGDTSLAFGAHLGLLRIISEVTNDITDFWNQARTFQANMTKSLEEKGPMKELVVMLMETPKDMDISEILENMSFLGDYYGTTNMGNLARTFKGEGDHVQVTDFNRSTSTTKNLCSHVIQTFRGRFLYGLDYEAELISMETARKYVDTIFRILKTVIEM